MADSFRPVFEGLQRAGEALVQANGALIAANQSLVHAGEALTQTANAALYAKNEHEDVRETVARLEGLVMQLGTEIRALRDERRNGGDR